jgi:hypothetical protein
MFPHVPPPVIARNLARTGMNELTIDNILEGRLDADILAYHQAERRAHR